MIGDGRAAIIGPVRQELLSGIAQPKQFASLLQSLRAFPDIAIRTDDWEHAARIANACRSSGIAGSTVDFLLCAVAIGNDMELFTADRDFARYATASALKLYRGVVWGPS